MNCPHKPNTTERELNRCVCVCVCVCLFVFLPLEDAFVQIDQVDELTSHDVS